MHASITKAFAMILDLHLNDSLTLKLSSDQVNEFSYPTDRIQKGLILFYQGEDLCEEAVGFGVPIVKRGLQAIFPGLVEISPMQGGIAAGLQATYRLNLVERVSHPNSGTIKSSILYRGKNVLAALIRSAPLLRRFLTHTSSLLRSTFSLQTTYETSDFSVNIPVTYSLEPSECQVKIGLNLPENLPLEITEVVMMNELGAHFFDHYQDSDGNSEVGDAIGCWDLVMAGEATFTDKNHRVSFTLSQVKGARLFRGRELLDKRLAWSGFGYSFQHIPGRFEYIVTIKTQ